jgi:bifunctional isochorismate lyase/aryl carrier protein
MSRWWNGIIRADDEMSKISSQIICDNEIVIYKNQYDAFYDTSLEKLLIQKSVKQLVITGVLTHLCCENTARSAFVRGFEVMFPVDTTATYNFDFHLSSILNLSHGYSNVMLLEELLSKF